MSWLILEPEDWIRLWPITSETSREPGPCAWSLVFFGKSNTIDRLTTLVVPCLDTYGVRKL